MHRTLKVPDINLFGSHGRRFVIPHTIAILWLVLGFLVGIEATARAQSEFWEATLGKKQPLLVSTPATGPWALKRPFDPEKFGQTRGTAPGLGRRGLGDATGMVMLITSTLSQDMLEFIQGMDRIADPDRTSRDPSEPESSASLSKLGNRSLDAYVHHIDSNGAQLGGFTIDQIADRIARLQELAETYSLKHVSMGIAANGSLERVGLNEKCDAVLIYVSAQPLPQPLPESGEPNASNPSPPKPNQTEGRVVWYRCIRRDEFQATHQKKLIEELIEAIASDTP
ncbi:MAG: hypothetical protein ACK5OB_00020 [Pirellula sp.]